MTAILVPSIAWAQNTPPNTPFVDPGLRLTAEAAGLPMGSDPITVTAKIINIVLGFLGVVFIVLIIYAGFQWMTASGNEEKISQAKKMIGNAVIGLLIILASYAITFFIFTGIKKSTLTGPAGTGLTCSSQGGFCTLPAACAAPGYLLGAANEVGCSGGQACCHP
ncbi:TPA: hypothetical protein DIC39_03425 [Patescibacteria group bacterium]|nr:hypothetical protein [Patescibacteria group bacterium]